MTLKEKLETVDLEAHGPHGCVLIGARMALEDLLQYKKKCIRLDPCLEYEEMVSHYQIGEKIEELNDDLPQP